MALPGKSPNTAAFKGKGISPSFQVESLTPQTGTHTPTRSLGEGVPAEGSMDGWMDGAGHASPSRGRANLPSFFFPPGRALNISQSLCPSLQEAPGSFTWRYKSSHSPFFFFFPLLRRSGRMGRGIIHFVRGAQTLAQPRDGPASPGFE